MEGRSLNWSQEDTFLYPDKSHLDGKTKLLLKFSWVLIFVFKFINLS